MAIAVQLEFNGATLEQHDQVIAKMGLQPGGQGPPGSLSHWVTKTPNGIRVTDVWEFKELFEQFAQEKIGADHRLRRDDRAPRDHVPRGPQPFRPRLRRPHRPHQLVQR